jgi:NAD(P)H-hydrate epimerase
MKLFSCSQIREIDKYTIRYEPVSSVDLMERAAVALFKWVIGHFERNNRFFIFTGPGNNGGDGLALGRMLAEHGYETKIYQVSSGVKTSEEWKVNRDRLENCKNVSFCQMSSVDDFPVTNSGDIIIDAIFGSGLSRPAEGLPADVIRKINKLSLKVISVDIPSGLFGEDNRSNRNDSIIKADHTLTLQFPKLSFLFSENYQFTGSWTVLPIGLHQAAVTETSTPFLLIENADVLKLLKTRSKFDHKGNFGHGLIAAGSYGKMGAAILSAKAALRTGIGLMTCYIPACGYSIMQSAVNEAMVITDTSDGHITDIIDTYSYDAVGIGPGIGTEPSTCKALHKLLLSYFKPTVIDADALNILSLNKEWLPLLSNKTVLTPHPREFERLAGESTDGYSRLMKQIEFSLKFNCIVILKGAHTSVSTPEGRVFFNSTGNPGMATAGSGDVLTGIILSLLAQGYPAEESSVLGVYLHGLAGDLAAEINGVEAVIASDIIENIGRAFKSVRDKQGK